MTEKENNLLAVFSENLHDLIRLCDEKNHCIEKLEASINEKDNLIQQANQKIEALQSKYINLLTARRLTEDEGEFQSARKRLNKLVRDVDKCIALLNE